MKDSEKAQIVHCKCTASLWSYQKKPFSTVIFSFVVTKEVINMTLRIKVIYSSSSQISKGSFPLQKYLPFSGLYMVFIDVKISQRVVVQTISLVPLIEKPAVSLRQKTQLSN